jgi:hypothetical protein
MGKKVLKQIPKKNAMPDDWGMAFFDIFNPQVFSQTGLDLLRHYVRERKIERSRAIEIAKKYKYLKK